MRNCLILALILVLALTLPAVAMLESHKLGPYTVSFELNTTEKLYILSEEPGVYENFRQYGLRIEDSHRVERGWLGINIYSKPIANNLDSEAAGMVKVYKSLGYTNITEDWRSIADRPGFVISGVDGNGELKWMAQGRLSDRDELVVRGEVIWNTKNVTGILDSLHVAPNASSGGGERNSTRNIHHVRKLG